jgi:hypothetical protein
MPLIIKTTKIIVRMTTNNRLNRYVEPSPQAEEEKHQNECILNLAPGWN